VKTDIGRESVRALAARASMADASSNPLAEEFYQEVAPRVYLTSRKKPGRASA
jgi:hypothetical protein